MFFPHVCLCLHLSFFSDLSYSAKASRIGVDSVAVAGYDQMANSCSLLPFITTFHFFLLFFCEGFCYLSLLDTVHL